MSTLEFAADVIVVGLGYAGATAAISAHDAGARVLVLEKQRYYGGLSIVSAGGMAVTDDAEAAFTHLRHTTGGTTPDAVLRVLAEGMAELPAYFRQLEAYSDQRFQPLQVIINTRSPAPYPLPGREHIFSLRVAPTTDFRGFPWAHGKRGGARLFRLLMDNIEARGIEVRCSTPARRLCVGSGGEIIGVETDFGPLLARRGVILACGGFEWNEEMKRQFLTGFPVFPVAAPGNTGDGLRMAMEVGADLWHMWMTHASYGFKFPEFSCGFRNNIDGPRRGDRRMPWIALDKHGCRFMNEYPPAPEDTPIRDLLYYDTEALEFPRIPCWLFFDDVGRREGPIAFPAFVGDEIPPYQWSEDNLAEVDRGWICQADDLTALAGQVGLPPAAVMASVERWNAACAAGGDADFQRPMATMMPITTPPFYAIDSWPTVSNTQGGPRHDELWRVLRPNGRPIPRLYKAGVLGSLFGHLYMEGGNLSECFVGGRVAGAHAAGLTPLG